LADILFPPNHEPLNKIRGDQTTTHTVAAGTYARVTWKLSVRAVGKITGGEPNTPNMNSDSNSIEITEWVKAGSVIGAAIIESPQTIVIPTQTYDTAVGTFESKAKVGSTFVSEINVSATASARNPQPASTLITLNVSGEAVATWQVEEYIVQGI